MSVEFKGPNPNFTHMKKDGGDVKVDGMRGVKNESVNHEDYSGHQRKPDVNPGAGKQSREVHGKNPFTEGALSGMEQPKMGKEDGRISKDKGTNEPPRAFKVNREGHAVDHGSTSEGAGYSYKKM